MVSLKDVFEYLKALLMGFHSKNTPECLLSRQVKFLIFFASLQCSRGEHPWWEDSKWSFQGGELPASRWNKKTHHGHAYGHCSLRKSIPCEVLGYFACCVCLCTPGLCGLPACVWMCSLLTTRDQKNLNLSTNCFTYLKFSHVSSPYTQTHPLTHRLVSLSGDGQ